jgi:hypothetical protein
MPNTPLENRKLSPWVTEGVRHRRRLEDQLHPLPKVTSPKYSGAWMDEVETRSTLNAINKARIWRESQSRQKTASKAASASEKPKALRLEQEANRERQTEQSVPRRR